MTAFEPRADGLCVNCGRSIGWHAGFRCYPPTATGMPSPVPLSPDKEKEASDA